MNEAGRLHEEFFTAAGDESVRRISISLHVKRKHQASLNLQNWGGRTRTSNFPVNSRAVCQLTYTPLCDAEKPRGLDAEESQTKHDRFAVSMNIQAAKTTDLPDILTLLKTAALPVAGIENHIATTLVARDSERLLGCAAVEVYGQAGLLRSVAVEAGHRGEGWGE